MKRNFRKQWIVTPDELPSVIRRCPKCGKKTEFINSGKFRVNANGCLIDVWLIYRCGKCETSWNMAIWERAEAGRIDEKEYEGFLKNDPYLAAIFGSDRNLFAKNKAEEKNTRAEYHILEVVTPIPCVDDHVIEIEVKVPVGFDLRGDLFLARQFSVSRSRIKKWYEEGLITSGDEALSPKSRVKDGMLLQIRTEAFKTEALRESHESDLISCKAGMAVKN